MIEFLKKPNLLYLGIIFIWSALQKTILNGIDGQGLFVTLLSIGIFLHNFLNFKSYRLMFYGKHSIVKLWFLWFIYAAINSIFLFDERQITLYTFISVVLFVPLIVMSIVASFPRHQLFKFLKYFQYSLYITFIIYFLNANLVEDRFNLELIDPNELSLIIILLLSLIFIRYVRLEINLIQLVVLSALPISFIILLGSRMGFTAVSILIMGLILLSKKPNKTFSSTKILILTPFIILILNLILFNTVLGERLLNTSNQNKTLTSNPAEGTVFENFGDRGVYYILGWKAFLEKPVFGIGLKNFTQYWSSVLHVEYMIQLAELGIVGFLIYFKFLMKIFNELRRKKIIYKASDKKVNIYLFFVFGALIFAGSVLFLYNSIAVAGLFGLLILLTKKRTLIKIPNIDYNVTILK
jgi:hypothetical protein